MFKPKLTYANVAATLALVFSMTGSAIAAHHYLITSTKQISPKVISALKGKTGKTGSAGPQGAAGKEGKEGKEGPPGKDGAVAGYSARLETGIEFTSSTSGSKTILTKQLPAGSFLVSGKTYITATSSAATTYMDVVCEMVDTPTSGAPTGDEASLTGTTNVPVFVFALGTGTLSFDLPVSTTSPNTVSIGCENVANGGNSYAVSAGETVISAVQTSHNS